MTRLAIIAGTGLSQIQGLSQITEQSVETPFGQPSAPFLVGTMDNREVIFLNRHGNLHTIPPHKINYRANIWALKQLGVEQIIAVAAVGGITAEMKPTCLVLPEQLIDYSYGRKQTFFADNLDSVTHIDFTYPYALSLRKQIIQVARQATIPLIESATYGCTQGPRLETAAEIIRMEQDGCHLVGMTGMPEAVLARELNIEYATIAVVANWAAGKSAGVIAMSEIEQHLKCGMKTAVTLLTAFLAIH